MGLPGRESDNYFFGDDPGKLDEYAWYAENSEDQAHLVGLKKPNPWGLFDVHGSVCEYCRDWSDKGLPSGQVSDPGGPSDGRVRVTRGGGYIGTPQSVSFGFRGAFAPASSLNHFGFRIICELDEPGPLPAGRIEGNGGVKESQAAEVPPPGKATSP
jgi:formylglycine-generating enzyme required for sulfatase activity